MLNRRNMIILSGSGLFLGTGISYAKDHKTTPHKGTGSMTTDINWKDISKTEWQSKLTEAEFHVLRKEGTERPFSSGHNDEKRSGTFVCAGCGLPLFKTSSKYESGTGWPSFFQPIEGNVETKRDFKMIVPRTEYHCKRCGGHQGHVFKDGPAPTGLRYCNNGVALDFEPS